MTEYRQGQRVRFLNDVGEAVVVSQKEGMVTVTDEDGFDRTVAVHELIPAPDAKEEAAQYDGRSMDMATLLRQEVGEKRMRSLQKEFEVKYRNASDKHGQKGRPHGGGLAHP